MRRRHTHKSHGQPSWYARAEPLAHSAEARCPRPAVGYALIAGSLLLLLVGSYAVFFSAFAPPGGTGVRVLDALAADRHYKYLPAMLVSAGTAFVISNWVGWQYYRNS